MFCASLLIAGHCFSQTGEIKPITAKPLQAPNNATWYFNTPDTAVWIAMGVYGQLKLASNQQLVKYYVPYKGANDTLDLGSQLITSKKQLLPLFNGACSVPTILDNGDGSITVGNGEYHVSTRVDGKGTQSYLISGGIFSLTDNTTNYLVADYNNGTPILHVITDVNLINETTVVPIYTAYRSGTVLHFQNWDALGVALANKVHQSIVKTQRYRRESGLGIAEVATRYLSVGNGRVWVGAVPVSVDAVITSSDNLRLFYHSGGVWTYSLQTQYNNSQYDNGTNLVALTSNRYAVNWIFRGIESQKHLYVVLGRGNYTLAQAQEAVLPAIPTAISSHAMLIGKLIVQNGATTATSIQSAFEVQFSTATPNAHNDLTGRDVADVHPAGSITVTPSGTISSTTVAAALSELDAEKEPILIKGNLVESVTGLEFSSTRQVIGGTTTLRLTSGYGIPTTTQISQIHPQGTDIQAPTRVGDLIGLTQTTTTISIADKEDKSNKENTTVDNSTIKYPTVNLLKTYADTKDPSISNEGSLTVTDKTSYSKNIHSNTTGSIDIVVKVDSIIPALQISRLNNKITISADTTFLIKKSTVAAMYQPKTNNSQQHLSGTNVTWNLANGKDADITLTGNTVITITNATQGLSGTLWVTNPTTIYTITFAGYVNSIDPFIRLASNMVITSGGNKLDDFTFKYNGSKMNWNGTLNRH